MAQWFASGLVVDLIILAMVLEAGLLGLWHRRTGRGIAFARLWPFLLAGVTLMLALRAALTGAEWYWISFWLLAGFVAHAADLWQRMR
ncbi:hypothetical protein [Ectothiorhodospira lacustris]|uniref:hypothetical protein n=1 Tax=Ectothiorhodospira lacustris TaxID=2899127 RepID=UPI001EE9086C|nr:hypothetical protein [Ectothiorhodospira lacustris]MCG5501273.1 hypothetical protein [Ectothiorhodospira lacustris]